MTGFTNMAFRSPYRAPSVNQKRSLARIVLEDRDLMRRAFGTAGASGAIAEPSGAWSHYAYDTGILDFDVHGDLGATLFGSATCPTWYKVGDPRPEEEAPELLIRLLDSGMTVVAPGGRVEPAVERVNAEPIEQHRRAREHAGRARATALSEIRRKLDAMKAIYTQRAPRDVVHELSDELGVGQLVIARAIGVTPTAVRKWRRGETARAEHRDRLSRFAALCSLLRENGVHDPASWIDIPISGESTLTPLDLFVYGRADLLVLLGRNLADPQEILDVFDPAWRTAFAPDAEYEVVTLSDGSRSVVPRGETPAA